ncbi:ParB/RepB/Spo0J family partition protein [Schaalia sp. ZJ405]|uniref:ParB/RepB/Spo0J family partition protein n=1 Tax=Schaalia sp. ZJ405 TaxID=2709403 RepID=UPI0013EDFE0B|nr:ParB/RepB/Spo0J family partition protein [Schaalia sp. ZJ405]QPK81314.1 ParB/RepB/Spo0J family partition protein [Schaalia sp. ZJ405]
MAAQKNSSEAQSPKTHSRHSALGRGLGALIPTAVTDNTSQSGDATRDPLDVFFPNSSSSASHGRRRGGSARDLLVPKPRAARSGSSPIAEDDAPLRNDGSDEQLTDPVVDAKTSVHSRPHKRNEQITRSAGSGTATQKPSRRQVKQSDTTDADRTKLFAEVLDGADENVSRETLTDTTPSHSAETSGNTGKTTADTPELVPVPGAAYAEIPIDQIMPNTKQPRSVFDEEDLEELSASIREVGVLQPVIVRPVLPGSVPEEKLDEYPGARFELIMGERRLRASSLAGRETIPAIVRQTEDDHLLRDALLENLHRAQLNPLEEASAYAQLMADFGATQEELSKRIARSRPQIANTLRLLKLPPKVQTKVAAQVISAGHARALLSLESAEDMERLADRIVSEGLSVRTTEELVRLGKIKKPQPQRARIHKTTSPLGEQVVAKLQDLYDTRVTISEGRTKGKIIIEFAGQDDLLRIADLIGH